MNRIQKLHDLANDGTSHYESGMLSQKDSQILSKHSKKSSIAEQLSLRSRAQSLKSAKIKYDPSRALEIKEKNESPSE